MDLRLKGFLLANDVTRIVTHAHCADGMASALILHDTFPMATVEFHKYNSREHREMEIEKGMLFCDFSPHPDKVQECLEAQTIVLDHHKKETVQPFLDVGLGVWADNSTEEESTCSGAALAAALRQFVLPNEIRHDAAIAELARLAGIYDAAIAELARLAGIYDTWRNKHPDFAAAREQAAALTWWEPEELLAKPWGDELSRCLDLGRYILKKELKEAWELAANAVRFVTPKGTRVAVVPRSSIINEVAEKLGDSADVVCGFSFRSESTSLGAKNPFFMVCKFSLRSHTGYDVRSVCENFGGGGHRAAAGFELAGNRLMSSPEQAFMILLREVERV